MTSDDMAHVERCVACGQALNRLGDGWTPAPPGDRAIHDRCQAAWIRQVAQSHTKNAERAA